MTTSVSASEQLQDYIERGGTPSATISSWFNMWKYQKACYVLAGGTETIQRNRLESVQEHHKVAVYEEAKRVYEYRQKNTVQPK